MELQRAFMYTSLDQQNTKKGKQAKIMVKKANVQSKKLSWAEHFLMRILGLFLTLLVMVISLTLLVFLVQNEEEILKKSMDWQSLLIIPAIVAIWMWLSPKIIFFLVKIERWSTEETKFKHYFYRSLALRLAYVLIIIWTILKKQRVEGVCLETQSGQFFYRLVLVDFVLEILISLIFPFCRNMMSRCFAKCCKIIPTHVSVRSVDVDIEMTTLAQKNLIRRASPRRVYEDSTLAEFRIADNILAVICRQALVLCGAVYSPMLVVVSVFFHFFFSMLKSLKSYILHDDLRIQ
eukprot:TRINITY_DN2455_c0_g1_i1.p1 TRINITY_DN2455_c0_g1~~TRINITY_DN2455_c0_g1_i1.p1  ORF type:complete len:292 (+),score=21.43 TRINITY_DN2455_c0_g1_i1:188-1063(+)